MKHKIAVIGDFRLDENQIGTYSGLSREEESLVIFSADERRWNPGAAGNLAANLAMMGNEVYALGIKGMDGDGIRMCVDMDKYDIDGSLMVEHGTTGSFIKQYFPSGKHVGRSNVKASEPTNSAIYSLRENIKEVTAMDIDAFIVADYDEDGRGVIVPEILKLMHIVNANTLTVGMSRNSLLKFEGYDYIICNKEEAYASSGYDNLIAASEMLKQCANHVVITLAGDGANIYGKHETKSAAIPLIAETIDPCGAGDSFTAAFITARLRGHSSHTCLLMGNTAARMTCQRKYGVGGYSTWSEVLTEFEELYCKSTIDLNLDHLQVVKTDDNHIWGKEYWLANCEEGGYGSKILEFHSGFKGSVHSHETKDEILMPLDGAIMITHWPDGDPSATRVLKKGQGMRIKPGEKHSIENGLIDTVNIFEVSTFEDEKTTKYEDADALPV